MKHTLIIAALLLGCALRAEADVAKLDVYADMNRTSCELYDNVQPPVVVVYYFVSGADHPQAFRFSAPKPACWLGASYAGDTTPVWSTGSSQDDWTVSFGVCLSGTAYVGRTTYIVSGQGAPCCQLSAVGSVLGHFEYLDCAFAEMPLAAGQSVTINPDASCPCQQPLATEPSTWGRVKSLYR